MKIGAQRREVAQPSQLQCGWAERNFSTAETILLIWTTPCTKTGRGQGAPSSPIHDGSGLPDKVQAVIHCVKDQGRSVSRALELSSAARAGSGLPSDGSPAVWDHEGDPDHSPDQGAAMSKRARKRRSRKGNAANHGKKPNA
jgi:hypothetical protein